MQVGAVSLLLVETAVARGPRVGIAAGMGVATVDLLFAAAAAAAGASAGAMLTEHEGEIRLVAAATLAGIALHGLITLRSSSSEAGRGPRGSGRATSPLRPLLRGHAPQPADDRLVRGHRRLATA